MLPNADDVLGPGLSTACPFCDDALPVDVPDRLPRRRLRNRHSPRVAACVVCGTPLSKRSGRGRPAITCGPVCKQARANAVDQSRRWHEAVAAVTDPNRPEVDEELLADGTLVPNGGMSTEERARLEEVIIFQRALALVEKVASGVLSRHIVDAHPETAEEMIAHGIARWKRRMAEEREDEIARARLITTETLMRPEPAPAARGRRRHRPAAE